MALPKLSIGYLLLASMSALPAVEWWQPEPFRRERLEGRPFIYNDASFLHRLSFEPKPGLGRHQRLSGNGIEGVAGSTRNDELYVRSELRLRKDFADPVFVSGNFRRGEDFDGDYDSYLFGLGLQYGNWELSAHGDIESAKENFDIHLRLHWQQDAHSLTATVVAVDSMFNDKQDLGSYLRDPYTFHLQGNWQLSDPVALYGFANYNAPSRLRQDRFGVLSDDEQISGGLGIHYQINESWEVFLEGQGLDGRRHTRPTEQAQLLDMVAPGPVTMDRGVSQFLTAEERFLFDRLIPGSGLLRPTGPPQQRLRRRHWSVSFEIVQELAESEQRWLGLHYFALHERDQRPAADIWAGTRQLRDYTLYVGQRWQWSPRFGFAPTLFLSYHDNARTYTGAPGLIASNQQFIDDFYAGLEDPLTSGFQGKLAPTLEYTFNQESGAAVRINPSLFIHKAAFGGGNVQVNIPF